MEAAGQALHSQVGTLELEWRRRRVLHERYILFILGLIIVALVTSKIGSAETVESFISFGATLSSLLLAVLAIFITISGNSDLTRFAGSMTATTHSLEQSSSLVSRNSEAAFKSAVELRNEINTLSGIISAMKISVESDLQGLKSTFEASSEKRELALGQSTFQTIVEHDLVCFSKVDCIQGASVYGLFLLYILARYFEASKSPSLSVIKTLRDPAGDYAYGFMVACGITGVLDYETNGNNVKLNKVLFSSMELATHFNIRISENSNALTSLNNESLKEDWVELKSRLDKFLVV